MKRTVSIILSAVILVSMMSIAVSAEKVIQKPVIVSTVYPTIDAIVADIVLTDAHIMLTIREPMIVQQLFKRQ